jgi:hypothetical protein
MHVIQSRRDFLATLSAAGAASILGGRGALADDRPPETTTLRLIRDPSICTAPGYIADELLRAEGFTDLRYLRTVSGGDAVARRSRLQHGRRGMDRLASGRRRADHRVGGGASWLL